METAGVSLRSIGSHTYPCRQVEASVETAGVSLRSIGSHRYLCRSFKMILMVTCS